MSTTLTGPILATVDVQLLGEITRFTITPYKIAQGSSTLLYSRSEHLLYGNSKALVANSGNAPGSPIRADSGEKQGLGRVPGSALDFLASTSDTWEIVFVDPPFGADLVEPSCALLNRPGLLAQAALVYVETAKREQPDFPHSWTLHREKQAGEVCYRLFIVDPG